MYLKGFGNYHQTEALQGALPTHQNSPQQCPFDLYAEQISGTAFTRLRHQNLHSWLYRILPSVAQGSYQPYDYQIIHDYVKHQSPNPLRWNPIQKKAAQCDFIKGLTHVAGNRLNKTFLYCCNQSMTNSYFVNNDGELLFVPYEGSLNLHTEMGLINITPGFIAVIPRGIKFKVELVDSEAKGYVAENCGAPFTLPNLGAIGANGLAHPRHFEYPCAAYEEKRSDCLIICKNDQQLWSAPCDHSPLNVVAWHGNYAPYRYDLSLFNTLNSVSYDHPDPSIFTVLTSESDTPGIANLDFVIFPPRWMVAEHTFRPPYFHRNYMNELMGLINGSYDAKSEGFSVGGFSIHNCMTAHGPDFLSYSKATSKELVPEFYNSLAFMFETNEPWRVTELALQDKACQHEYAECWQGFKDNFSNN